MPGLKPAGKSRSAELRQKRMMMNPEQYEVEKAKARERYRAGMEKRKEFWASGTRAALLDKEEYYKKRRKSNNMSAHRKKLEARRTMTQRAKVSRKTLSDKERHAHDRQVVQTLKASWSQQMAQATSVSPTDDAVYLTPYLQNGERLAGKSASHVSIPHFEGGYDLDSWAGYISVGENSSNHLFFWYFCCTGKNYSYNQKLKTDISSAPLIIWLNGGPGYSSMLGLFEEIGPLMALSNGSVTTRDISWTNDFNVIFIDSLIDTGFSYSDSGQRTKSVNDAAEQLYEFMDQFYEIFQDSKAKDLYICGESYGAKYASELAGLIKRDRSMNLKGVLLASGLMNPRQMLPLTPDFLESIGMLNEMEATKIRYTVLQSLENYESNPKGALMDILSAIFDKLKTVMGNEGTSILHTRDHNWTLGTYLNQPAVQRAIHAKPTPFVIQNKSVALDMAEDFLDDVQDVLKSLLNAGVKVLVYNGQFDPAVSVPMTEKFLSTLEWFGNREYLAGDSKVIWKDNNGIVAGYVTKIANFTRVILRNAGHRTAIDQPFFVLEMVKRFVSNLPFSDVDSSGCNSSDDLV